MQKRALKEMWEKQDKRES